ncbi:MAG: hypothetical protein ACC656_04710 [Candidatus Heimdallarchaeota archaeon]
MYKHRLLSSISLFLLLNINTAIAVEEYNFQYSEDLRIGNTFQWRVDNIIFKFFIDNVAIDPTNVLYSEEVHQSGIIYFPDSTGIPAETNGSIYELTINQDIDLVSSFDFLITSFDFTIKLDNEVLPQSIDGLDRSKPLFNFFMKPSAVVYDNSTRINYFESLGSGSISYEETLNNNYNSRGFYPSRITQLSSFIRDGVYVEQKRTADCIEENNQAQTCDSLASFVEFRTVTRSYDTISGKLLKYDYTENRSFDPSDRLYPSNVAFNLTNIDATTGSGPEIPVVIPDDEFSVDIPQSILYLSAFIVIAFVIVIAALKFSKKNI